MNFSPQVSETIYKKTGMTPEQLSMLSEDDERRLILKITGKNLTFSKKRDSRKFGRGNPLLARKRLRTMDYIDSRISKLK